VNFSVVAGFSLPLRIRDGVETSAADQVGFSFHHVYQANWRFKFVDFKRFSAEVRGLLKALVIEKRQEDERQLYI
jgi:hypothetical protein